MSWKEKEIKELEERVDLLEAEKSAREERQKEPLQARKAGSSFNFADLVKGTEKEQELEQVRRDLSQTREGLKQEGEKRKKQEEEVKALQTELSIIVERVKKEELEDVEMGGISLSSQKTMVDAATNTEKRTYAQAAVQAQIEGKPEVAPPVSEVSVDKGKKPEATSLEGARTGSGDPRSQVGRGTRGAMAKAVVIHGVSTNWKVSRVADYVEGVMGRVIGVRWLLGAVQRAGKMASSVVVYPNREVFLGPMAHVRMAEVQHSAVPYRWGR